MTAKITGTPLSALKYEITSAHNYHSHLQTHPQLLDHQQARFSLNNQRNPQKLPLLNQPNLKIAKFKLNGGRARASTKIRFIGGGTIKDKEERDKRLVSIFKENEPPKSKTEEASADPEHPNFPFPVHYKKIDFNKINPYKLAVAAEFLKKEKRRLEEPFIKHTEKMQELANLFDETLERNKYMLETSPIEALINAKKEEKSASRVAVIPHEPYSDVVREKSKLKAQLEIAKSLTQQNPEEPDALIIRDKKSPGHYWIKGQLAGGSVTANRGSNSHKLPGKTNGYTSVYLPDPQTVQNVQNWLKANFSVKPVPLILHPPKVHKKFYQKKTEDEDAKSKAEEEDDDMYGLRISDHRDQHHTIKDFDRTELRELHITNGLVKSPKVFHGAFENSFASGYDLAPARNLMQITLGPIQPHFFRFILGLADFNDNEIVFQTRKNILYVTARSPGKANGINPRKVEEIVELPDGVTIKNLKFYRSIDRTIVIEEIANNQSKHNRGPTERYHQPRRHY